MCVFFIISSLNNMNDDDINKLKHAISNFTNKTDIRDLFYPRNFEFPIFIFKEIYFVYFLWFCITMIIMFIIYFINIFYQD